MTNQNGIRFDLTHILQRGDLMVWQMLHKACHIHNLPRMEQIKVLV